MELLVRAVASEGDAHGLPDDHLVVALGASTNRGRARPAPDDTIDTATIVLTAGIVPSAVAGAIARVFGVRLTGFLAWWLRRTYYLFQMPRWDRRLRMVLDCTVALFFRPDITRVDLRVERAGEASAPGATLSLFGV
jgi:hypothetical protein